MASVIDNLEQSLDLMCRIGVTLSIPVSTARQPRQVIHQTCPIQRTHDLGRSDAVEVIDIEIATTRIFVVMVCQAKARP